MKTIEPPTFAPWETFTNAQLDGMLITWRWIRSQSDWAFWHGAADEFSAAIEFELQSRATLPSALSQPTKSPPRESA